MLLMCSEVESVDLEYETDFWSVIYNFRIVKIIMLTIQESHRSYVQSRTNVAG